MSAAAEVSAGDPCPFLRALTAAGYIDSHVERLEKVSELVAIAGAVPPAAAKKVKSATYLIGLVGNGLRPSRLLRNWRRGLHVDGLRGGPLDKRGAGSRILDPNGQIDEHELARLDEFAIDAHSPDGTEERGLGADELSLMMDANFSRARGQRRRIDRKLMEGEWPVLLKIMGKGADADAYLSVDEVRALFTERLLPPRIIERLSRRQPN